MALGTGADVKFLATAGGVNGRALFAGAISETGTVKFLEAVGGEGALYIPGGLRGMAVAAHHDGPVTVGGSFMSTAQFGVAKKVSLTAEGLDAYLVRINSADGLQCQ